MKIEIDPKTNDMATSLGLFLQKTRDEIEKEEMQQENKQLRKDLDSAIMEISIAIALQGVVNNV